MENNTSVASISGKEKAFAIIAYIGLWWIGMLPTSVRESAYLKNHVNNGITLSVCATILACIPVLGWIADVAIAVFIVLGIIAAATNKYFSIPLISKVDFIKFYW
ncbi:MAG: hypothetical protein MJ166_08200 [Clostridia bacterium]|nr:hypothetical protein [Clostridia bacterium]